MTDLYRLLPEEMDALVTSFAEPRYRADQVLRGLWSGLAESVDAIPGLPRSLRERLSAEGHGAGVASEVTRVESEDGETTKLLLRMERDTLIESVLMQYPEEAPARHPRSTVCVSTQAGCAMGCVFCATGQMGFERNLAAEEIVAQVIHIQRLLAARGQHVTNVVFMGMGEPLANYGETLRAVKLLTGSRTFGLAQRSITISTVGLVNAIDRLADEGLQVGLAISLHTADESLRRRLVPTASEGSVEALIAAARRYKAATGRRVSFEYALMAGVNDSDEAARQLAARLAGTGAHVNLIPVNPTAGAFERPQRSRVVAFQDVLLRAGIAATVRVEKGSEISAACGQLRTDTAPIRSGAEPPVHGHRQAMLARAPSPDQSQTPIEGR